MVLEILPALFATIRQEDPGIVLFHRIVGNRIVNSKSSGDSREKEIPKSQEVLEIFRHYSELFGGLKEFPLVQVYEQPQVLLFDSWLY